jgi:acyl-coenzyme A thioesterase PaaI-like protein
LEFVTLLDLGSGVNGFAKTAHGGFYGVVLDEVMGSAAQMQASELSPLFPYYAIFFQA